MLNDQIIVSTSTNGNDDESDHFRDIHALVAPSPPHPSNVQPRPREAWETSSLVSSTSASSENFTSMSREFSALVLAGSAVADPAASDSVLARIGEDEIETNPLAIVADSGGDGERLALSSLSLPSRDEGVTVERVKKEEVESKISAWQNAKVAKINNRFKREDAVITGWESEKLHQATSWMKKVERKLEEKRAKAVEKMQNDMAKARRKAEERRASAEATRGTKVARVFEIANLMRAVGRAPAKRSFF